jgi:imidazolonepropionase
MGKVTLIRGARQLLTLRGPSGPRRGAGLGNLGLIEDGAVLIVDGLIREVGPSRRVENLALAREAEEIDASACVVMPGFVDSGTHLASGPARVSDYEMQLAGATSDEVAGAGGGVLGIARSIRDLSVHALESIALRALEEAVRHGATALEAKSGLGLTDAGEIKILKAHSALRERPVTVVSTFQCARPAPGYEQRSDEYLEWIRSHLLPLVKRRKLAEFADIHCGEGGFTAEQTLRYLSTARELGFGLKLHAEARANRKAIRMAVELEATSVDAIADLDAEDARVLARSPTIATLSPGAAFHLRRERYPPARMLIDSGAAVALGTNYNPATSPSQSMPMMIALACRSMHMSPAEAVTASTLNAAYAIRRASSVGSLEAWKSADLLLLGVPDYREIPYHFGVNLVELVIKSGQVLVKRSEVQWPGR